MTRSLAAFLVAGSLCSYATAQDSHKRKLLDKETFMEMESVGGPAISPDGRQIVFTRSWVDKMKDQQRSNIWIVDVDGQRVRELTRGSWRDNAPVWSPDGKRIAFLSDRDGTTQVHILWVDTGELAQLTHVERAPANLTWSPDGKRLAFTVQVPDNDPLLA
ncbi:MAG TPA: DPP IV N-terminal domain-containing protein, partial [Blastocatellia bacterium]|nr:DPP IV N-terminal domain-containing protein [Blastocatellia bacterium]